MSKPQEISLEIKGKIYKGYYSIEKGVISVSTGSSRKSTQLGNSPADTIARMLLREIIEAGEFDD